MSGLPPHLVVDASVGAKLFVAEEHSPQAKTLFQAIGGEPHFQPHVPDLFYAECANILWKYVRHSGYSPSDALKDISALRQLGLKAVSTALLAPRALDLALEWEVTAYDACYLALAEELKAPLVTADQKLLKRLKGAPVALRWIGDFPS